MTDRLGGSRHRRWDAKLSSAAKLAPVVVALCCAGSMAAPPLTPISEQPAALDARHLVFDQPASGVISRPSPGIIAELAPDDAPRPEAVPLPPALIPAAVVLGWAMLRARRRRA